MKKKFKKICLAALAIAITAASTVSIPVSAIGIGFGDITSLSDFTVIDDKGMMKYMGYTNDGYKMIYDNAWGLLRAEPRFGILKFVLSEDVDYEEANEKVVEIFKEFYPDNYLDVSPVPTGENPPATGSEEYLEYVKNYRKNYKPNLTSYTIDGITTYTVCVAVQNVTSINDEKVAEARKYSKAFMKKLNDEKLISAFYDFGEMYGVFGPYAINIGYSSDVDIDLIYNYIDEHNIDCNVKKDDYRYTLEFNDDTDEIEQFLIAADIYEETSIAVDRWFVPASGNYGDLYGKNALENLTKAGNANEDETTDIRDAAFIARKVAQRKTEELPEWSDYNNDGNLDILDAAAIAKDVAGRILK